MFNDRFLTTFVALMLLAALPLAAQTAQGPAKTTDAATSAVTNAAGAPLKLDLKTLLADSTLARPEFQFLRARRRALARHAGGPADFGRVADELAARQAWYPALELLWFAEKFSQTPKARQALAERMKKMKDADAALDGEVDSAVQMWDAGRRDQALDVLRGILRQHPYGEKAHFQLAVLTHDALVDREEAKKPVDPEQRIQAFRTCYGEFLATIAIDPLYEEAYYQLDKLRTILADQHAFLVATNPLSRRGMIVRLQLKPPLDKLDSGDRAPETLLAASEGFEAAGNLDYAVYATQAALSQSGEKGKLTSNLRKRLERLRKVLK